MKKFALALTAAAAVALGSAGVADAGGYPPGGEQVVVDDSTVGPGDPVTVTASCTLGETVVFQLVDSFDTVPCVAPSDASDQLVTAQPGTATGTVNAPTTAGTYTGTVTGSISGALGTFVVVVEGDADGAGGDDGDDDDGGDDGDAAGDDGDDGTAGGTGGTTTPSGNLPSTGSDGTSTMTMMAGGLLVVGLGMFGVATLRRRQDIAAA